MPGGSAFDAYMAGTQGGTNTVASSNWGSSSSGNSGNQNNQGKHKYIKERQFKFSKFIFFNLTKKN